MTTHPNYPYPTLADQVEGLATLQPGETHIEATDRVFRARTAKAPGEYLIESIVVGDLVKPNRRLFASKVATITDLGGSIVLHLADGSTLEQKWGHVVEVVAPVESALVESLARLAAADEAEGARKPWTPPTWDCRTPSGHHFAMSFTDIAQRDAVEAHWLDRHDYCKACADCDGCSHPDCGTCHCD